MKNFTRYTFIVALIVLISMGNETQGLKIKLKKDHTPAINYKDWVEVKGLPAEIDGVKQYYPISVAVSETEDSEETDTVAVIIGSIPLKGLTAKQILLASLVYAQEHFNSDMEEGFLNVNYDSKTCSMILKSTQGTNSNETTYTRIVNLTALDGILEFEVSEIDCRYREKGLIPRTIRMEKLHPERNKRHEELVKEFIGINSLYMVELEKYVASRKNIDSPNFAKLGKTNDPEIGMNEDEVTIILGMPMDKRKSGERKRWIYANDYVVIFTNGKVSKIVR